MNLTEIRQTFPQYNEWSDKDIATTLHEKHYSDWDFEDFSEKIGYVPEKEPGILKETLNAVVHSSLGIPGSYATMIGWGGKRLEGDPNKHEPDMVFKMMTPGQKDAVGRLKGEYSRILPGDQAFKKAVKDVIGKDIDKRNDIAGAVAGFGHTASKHYEELQEPFKPSKRFEGKNIIDDPEIMLNPAWVVPGVVGMLPSLAASIIPAVGTRGAILKVGKALVPASKAAVNRLAKFALGSGAFAGGASGGALEASQTYKAVLKETGSEEQAARAAEMMWGASGLLNSAGNLQFLTYIGKSFIKRAGVGFVVEGVTEGLEEPAEVASKLLAKVATGEPLPNNILKMFADSLKDGASVGFLAGFTGGGAAVFSGGDGKKQADLSSLDTGKQFGPPEATPEETGAAEEMSFEEAFDKEFEARRAGFGEKGPTKLKSNTDKLNRANAQQALYDSPEYQAQERNQEKIEKATKADERRQKRRDIGQRKRDTAALAEEFKVFEKEWAEKLRKKKASEPGAVQARVAMESDLNRFARRASSVGAKTVRRIHAIMLTSGSEERLRLAKKLAEEQPELVEILNKTVAGGYKNPRELRQDLMLLPAPETPTPLRSASEAGEERLGLEPVPITPESELEPAPIEAGDQQEEVPVETEGPTVETVDVTDNTGRGAHEAEAPGKVTVTDKGVRDHSQQAVISGDTITVNMKVGRKKRGSYSIPLSEWEETSKHPNPAWAKKKLAEKYADIEKLREEPGGASQADRIVDSAISAINKAYEQRSPQPEPDLTDNTGGGSPKAEKPEEPDIDGYPAKTLKETQVNVKGLTEAGDTVEYKESAHAALSDINAKRDIYQELKDCIG